VLEELARDSHRAVFNFKEIRMSTYILIFFFATSTGKGPTNLGVYSSEQACQIAAIQVGAMLNQPKPSFICVSQ
jgi:hypothetical protein